MESIFELEKPIIPLDQRLLELKQQQSLNPSPEIEKEISSLERQVEALISDLYKNLTSWQRVMLSRHPKRPYSKDYIEALFPDFMELHGDRTFGDDQAIIAGLASWPPAAFSSTTATNTGTRAQSVLIIAHQKGRSTKQKIERNFGMARPEGYRKAMRLMQLAERSKIPVLTFIDTPGAHPGTDAEERGQAQSIAESIQLMFSLTIPVLSVVIGEGGSGGALAIGVANRLLMQQYSTYSVISPESCASILWSDSTLADKASEKLKMSAEDLKRLGVADAIIAEPPGGAHRDWPLAFDLMREALLKEFGPYFKKSASGSNAVFKRERASKFRALGAFVKEKRS